MYFKDHTRTFGKLYSKARSSIPNYQYIPKPEVLGSTPDRSTGGFPVPEFACVIHWIIHHSHSFARLKVYHHIYSIAHIPHIDIPILAVCRMFVP